ncbi:MAG: hypothetical protein AAFQ98_23300, partial [Bacteroidota bacterium]
RFPQVHILPVGVELLTVLGDGPQFYANREYMNLRETEQQDKLEAAHLLTLGNQGITLLANALSLIPKFEIGVASVGPYVTSAIGGQELGMAANFLSSTLNTLATVESYKANEAGMMAGYDRRQEEWDFQAAQAERELVQIDQQIAGAEVRLAMAQNDLTTHDLQITQADEELQFLETKFSKYNLYSELLTIVSGLYRSAYDQAYAFAHQAERALRYELPKTQDNTKVITYGHWDTRVNGLLAGERLMRELCLLDQTYIESNEREHELVKHVSLKMLNPEELIRLRATGQATFEIPEILYDLDHPGHYLRRIKSVSVSVPCISGPYTSISADLKYSNAQYRPKDDINEPLVNQEAVVKSMATSTGQQDSGVFELNFRDERYLPFEGAGAAGTWNLSLQGGISDLRTFDFDSISDVVLHIRYCARSGQGGFQSDVKGQLTSQFNQLVDNLAGTPNSAMVQAISLKQLFPEAYYALVEGQASDTRRDASISLSKKHFPFFLAQRKLSGANWKLMVRLENEPDAAISLVGKASKNPIATLPSTSSTSSGLDITFSDAEAGDVDTTWNIALGTGVGVLSAATVEDIYLLVDFSI